MVRELDRFQPNHSGLFRALKPLNQSLVRQTQSELEFVRSSLEDSFVEYAFEELECVLPSIEHQLPDYSRRLL